ncbi:MAG: DUF3368 domain-containing protein [Verrucomicrobia bacterium]|nr:DUF3368 domain-containing protein [Verrucomicrobiota bacterium]
MNVVVSDTSPLHYLILCGSEEVLPRLFARVFIPPAVLRELQHAGAPPAVSSWAAALPAWVTVQAPQSLDVSLAVDPGESEAICLAREIKADAILMDDRAGRAAATHCGLRVIGTLGLLEQAAARGFLDFAEVMKKLGNTNVRLDPGLVKAALARDAARRSGLR